jgi:hypothetical protein
MLSIFLAYVLSSAVGILMTHSGNHFALGERDRIVGEARATEPAAASEKEGKHVAAALHDFAGNVLRAAVPQTLLGIAVIPPYFSVAYQGWVGGIVSVDGHHRSRLARFPAASYYLTVLLLQFIPFSLAIGAGVRAGLDLFAHNAAVGWRIWQYRIPRPVFATLLGAYALAVPLFLLASMVEFLWPWSR